MRKNVIKTKDEARRKAINFQNWQSEQSISWREVIEWKIYFKKLASKFKLQKEFKENGII